MKANFKVSTTSNSVQQTPQKEGKDLTKEEFEQYMIKAGAAGSFMVFRSDNKDDELGLEEL
ncbi:MAG: hypothetical protein KGL95_06460 [Patescibacteria group bacterium]|nr:hypothetical protein [Patescibacteria group bacterium]